MFIWIKSQLNTDGAGTNTDDFLVLPVDRLTECFVIILIASGLIEGDLNNYRKSPSKKCNICPQSINPCLSKLRGFLIFC